MIMQSWQLPEHLADILPDHARYLESAKEQLLALFRVHGYELVYPPLMEYSNSLLTHIDSGLSLKTIRIVDQLSGRQLGIRADITPQVARIDAHLLAANHGINRLCYSAPVLHARPDGLLSTREPWQTGAELYGLNHISADIELIDLMLKSLKIGHIQALILSLGHIGIFRALAEAAHLTAEQSRELLALMQDKDSVAIHTLTQQWELDDIWRHALVALPELYGGREILALARQKLPQLTAVNRALDDLETVCQAFPNQDIHIDLSELRVDHYHTGLLYAAYSPNHHDALARGGRYDGLGKYFGRERPATGFSFDLRLFDGKFPAEQKTETIRVAQADAARAASTIAALREQGICVIIDYGLPSNKHINAQLIEQNGEWHIQKLPEN